VRFSLAPYGLSHKELNLLLNSPDLFRDSFGTQRTEQIRVSLTSAYRDGFRIIFIVGAALNTAAFVAAWFWMPQVELARKDDAQLKEEGKKRNEEKLKKASKV
jgi:hypothetical protein